VSPHGQGCDKLGSWQNSSDPQRPRPPEPGDGAANRADWRRLVAFALPLAIGVVLPLATHSIDPETAHVLGVLDTLFLFVFLPAYCLVRALARWAVADDTIAGALTRSVGVIPRLEAKQAAAPVLTLSLIALNAAIFALTWWHPDDRI
jgi:hypothetical protein